MRGLAYGILDPNGERYRLALIHRSECPACRAYVVSLRGLAAVLPPVFLPWGLGAQVLARAAGRRTPARGSAPTRAPLRRRAPWPAAAQAPRPSANSVARCQRRGPSAWVVRPAAPGSWPAEPLSAKLAVGCVLALGVGAGCVALTEGPWHPRAPRHGHASAHSGGSAPAAGGRRGASGLLSEGRLAAAGSMDGSTGSPARGSAHELTPAQQAVREFGPEHGSVAGAGHSNFSVAGRGSTAGSSSSRLAGAAGSTADPASLTAHERSVNDSSAAAPPRASPAEREFGIG